MSVSANDIRNYKMGNTTGWSYSMIKGVQDEIERRKAAGVAANIVHGITLANPGTLDRTVSDRVSGKNDSVIGQMNPEQQRQIKVYYLNEEARAGSVTVAQYQSRLAEIEGRTAELQQQRSIDTALRAAPGLRAAAKAEAQRFADLGAVDYIGQQQRHTTQLEKVAADVAKSGFDVAKLTQAKGKPNVNAQFKINTPSEIKQNQFGKSQAFRTVQSVTPSYGVDIVDSSGKTVAKNVKQSGGFGFAETGKSPILTQAIIGASGNVLGTLTGKSPGSVFTIFETKKQTKSLEVQGPQKEIFLPSYVKNAFYTFEDTIGPKDPRFTGLVGKDLFVKDEFAGRVNYLGVPPNTTFLSTQINRLAERSDKLLETKRDPLSQVLVPFGTFPVAVVSGLYNLAGLLEPDKAITVKTPRTLGGDYLGAQIEGISKAVTTGDRGELFKGNIEAQKKADEFYKQFGPISFASSAAVETVGVPFSKLSPIKGGLLPIPTEQGPKILGQTIKIGYGKLSTPIITRIEGKIGLGSGKGLLGKETFKELSPASVDVTTGRTLKAFELATVKGGIQNILTSKQGLKSLVGAGKIRPDDVAYLKAQKQLAELAALGQKKLGQKDLLQVDVLSRSGFEGLETIAEQETFIEKIIPKLKPVKGSQLFLTQLREGLKPTGFKSSDTDIDYLGGLLGDRFATSKANKMAQQTVRELNEIMTSQRGAVAKGSKVFTGIIEGVVFPRPKTIKLKGQGTKVMELLTKGDVEEGANSILSDQSRIFGVGKTRKTVKTPTGYRGFLGFKKTRKEVPLPTQLLNQISSSTRIQVKGIEDVYAGGGSIPFLKKGYTDLLRTKSGFRVGPDVHRIKDLVRQQPVSLQIAELLEAKGYKGKVAQVKGIFETIKKSKPEIDFDAAFKEVEKIGESENIESIASYYARQSKRTGKGAASAFRLFRPTEESEAKQKPSSIQSNLNIKLDNLITSSIRGSSRISSSPSILESLSSIGKSIMPKSSIGSKPSRSSTSSKGSKPSRASPSLKSPISFSGIYGRSMPSITSPLKVSVPSVISPGSPTSPGSPGSPTTRSPPFKSPPKSPTIRLPIIKQPPSSPVIKFPKLGFLLPKFEQLRTQRLPSYSKKRLFIADIADPKRPGTFAPKGVKKRISSSPEVFRQIDKDLAKARRNKKAFDPLIGFTISKSGKDVYSTKNLIGKFSKFKI